MRSKCLWLICMIVIFACFSVAYAEEKMVSGPEEMLEAEKTWKELLDHLKNAEKPFDAQSFINKDVLFSGYLAERDEDLLKVKTDEFIECIVIPNKEERKDFVSDVVLVRVLGTVIGIKPESLQVTVQAKNILVTASQ